MHAIGLFILNHWLLFLALLIIVSLLLVNAARGKLLNFQEVRPAAVVQLMNHHQPLLLDVRNADEFSQAHISTAINIPYEQLAERIDELQPNRDHQIIVYCHNGQRSAHAATLLGKQGFPAVAKLRGGLQEWRSAHLPLNR